MDSLLLQAAEAQARDRSRRDQAPMFIWYDGHRIYVRSFSEGQPANAQLIEEINADA